MLLSLRLIRAAPPPEYDASTMWGMPHPDDPVEVPGTASVASYDEDDSDATSSVSRSDPSAFMNAHH